MFVNPFIIVPQGRLELPRNLIHQILSLTRINHFRHTGIYYRSGGTRTLNPFLSRPPGLSRRCIPIPITDRYLAELEGFEPSGRYSRPAPQQGAHISHSCTTPDLELSAGFEPAMGILSTAELQSATFDRSVTRQLNFSCR